VRQKVSIRLCPKALRTYIWKRKKYLLSFTAASLSISESIKIAERKSNYCTSSQFVYTL